MNPYQQLVDWSKSNYSDLPWRKERTAYNTLVSEIMLQQTTVGAVRDRFIRFIDRFPSIEILANASLDEVHSYWQGLGYYRRATNLHASALKIVELFDSMIPNNRNDLLSCPGIGEYTASALIAIFYNEDDFAVDANIERVFSRVHLIDAASPQILKKMIKSSYRPSHFLKESASVLNESLMDLGREICSFENAKCPICPLNTVCKAYSSNQLQAYPVRSEKIKKSVLKLARIIVENGEAIYLVKRESGQWLERQWELPTFVEQCDEADFCQYPKIVESDLSLHEYVTTYKTVITKYQIENRVYKCSRIPDVLNVSLVSKELLSSYHLSQATKKALQKVGYEF